MGVVTAFCAVAIAVTFAISAVHKLKGPELFREQLRETLPLPGYLIKTTGYAIPGAEVAALAMVLSPYPLAGFALAFVLFLSFTVYLAVIIRSGSGASCGCVGRAAQPASKVHLYRNAVFLLLCLAGGFGAMSEGGVSPVQYAVAAGPAVPVGAGLLYLDELAAFFRPSAAPALRPK
ncbi:hypothetical protein VT50_0217085 [Streptomyces antioxidans]|uniref:Methylamine utilisation protein MauE domain-containing protein n=1 Tax=Streptomyces antioxidans TaxID=1507734 RepID=A0A1V4D4A3_9ACTN|nr:MauE/DoxX family redox-associated membrane protein [Streptomyces antioxidans]OPF79081.1 hypothetical protein VT50_0217085 [Streptomyces antioxidans]